MEREGLSRAHTQPAGPDESHDHRPAARQRVSGWLRLGKKLRRVVPQVIGPVRTSSRIQPRSGFLRSAQYVCKKLWHEINLHYGTRAPSAAAWLLPGSVFMVYRTKALH